MTNHKATTAIAIIVLALVIMATSIGRAEAHTWGTHSHIKRSTPGYCKTHANGVRERKCIVRVIFSTVGEGRKAVSVASCETGRTFSPTILGPNDEYGNPRIGVWQFGTRERRVYGYGRTVTSQTYSALRYWRVSGWSPWSCA